MRAKTMHVAFAITDFEQYLNADTIGKEIVPASVQLGSVKLTANFSAKSLRKAQVAFNECGGEAVVFISGDLDFDAKAIHSAGIVVHAKIPKPAAS